MNKLPIKNRKEWQALDDRVMHLALLFDLQGKQTELSKGFSEDTWLNYIEAERKLKEYHNDLQTYGHDRIQGYKYKDEIFWEIKQ